MKTEATMKMQANASHRSDYSYATKEYTHFPSVPQAFEASSKDFATLEEAKEFAARFPKSLRVGATTCSGVPDGNGGFKTVGFASFRADLSRDGTTHGKNESSIRRIRGFLKACEKLGIEIEWRTPFVNAYATRADFEAALSAEEAS